MSSFVPVSGSMSHRVQLQAFRNGRGQGLDCCCASQETRLQDPLKPGRPQGLKCQQMENYRVSEMEASQKAVTEMYNGKRQVRRQ
ncbi:hypothetical protein GN956_G18728 [Arapaima gigas]